MFALFGANRVGKTTLLKNLIREWRKSHIGCPVIGFDPQLAIRYEDKNGIKVPTGLLDEVIEINEKNTWVDRVLKKRNCLLVLDEFRLLHPSPQSSDHLLKLLAMWAQYNMDVMMTFHAPSLVLDTLTYYITHYMVFYTQAVKQKFQDKLSNFEIVLNASAFVNKYVEQQGLGEYPIFPYVCVNNKTGDLTAVNFKQEWVNNYIRTMSL